MSQCNCKEVSSLRLPMFFMFLPFFTNLLSVSALFSKGCKVHVEESSSSIYCPNGTHLGAGIQERNLFCLSLTNHALIPTRSPPKLPIKLWHQCLGHLGFKNVKKLQDHSTKMRLNKTNIFTVCKSCLAKKQHRTLSHQPPQRAKECLELIHLDVGGPVTPPSAGRARYWLTFTDDYTQKTWIYFMKKKSKALQKLQKFTTWIQQQAGQNVKLF